MIGRLLVAAIGWFVCQGALALAIEEGDAGFSYQFNALRSSFVVINDSSHDVRLLSIKPARPADRVITSLPEKLTSGQRLKVDVELLVEDDYGARAHAFYVDASDTEKPAVARVRVYGLSALYDVQRPLEFGVVDMGATPKLEFAVAGDDPAIRVKAIKSTPGFVTAEIADDGKKLLLTHSPASAWGRLEGVVKLELDSQDQPEAWLPVTSEVKGQVRPSTTIFALGLARVGSENEYILQYRHVDDEPFRFAEAVIEGIATTKISTENCVNKEDGCQQVRFVIDESRQPTGQLKGVLRTRIAGLDREIFVPMGGLLVAKNTKVESLESVMAAAKNAQKPEENLGLALKKLKSDAHELPFEPVIPPGDGPVLRWSVDNDSVVYGYAIFRAERSDGPFRMQPIIVRRLPNARDGVASKYVARDNTAIAGKDYWYRIATLFPDGKREFLTAAQRVKAGSPGSSQ